MASDVCTAFLPMLSTVFHSGLAAKPDAQAAMQAKRDSIVRNRSTGRASYGLDSTPFLDADGERVTKVVRATDCELLGKRCAQCTWARQSLSKQVVRRRANLAQPPGQRSLPHASSSSD